MNREHVTAATKKLADEGRLVQAGWESLQHAAGLTNAPQIQIDEMRKAFFAGAKFLLDSILFALDPDDEPTAEDLERMSKINRELENFGDDLVRDIKTEGNG